MQLDFEAWLAQQIACEVLAEALPAPVALQRVDAARNLHRAYGLAVERDLFGAVVLVRQFGRIGRTGRQQRTSFKTVAEAAAAFDRLQRQKRARGYMEIAR